MKTNRIIVLLPSVVVVGLSLYFFFLPLSSPVYIYIYLYMYIFHSISSSFVVHSLYIIIGPWWVIWVPGRSIQRSVPLADNTQHTHIFRTCLKIPDRTGSPRLVWNTENVRRKNTKRLSATSNSAASLRQQLGTLWQQFQMGWGFWFPKTWS